MRKRCRIGTGVRRDIVEAWLFACGWKHECRGGYEVSFWYSPDATDSWDHDLKLAVRIQVMNEVKAYLQASGWGAPTLGGGFYDPLKRTGKRRFCSTEEAVRRQKERDSAVPAVERATT